MRNKPDADSFDDLIRLRTYKQRDEDTATPPPNEAIAKIKEDIDFLRGRIDHIKRSPMAQRDPTIIETYESMLKDREATLEKTLNNPPSTQNSENT